VTQAEVILDSARSEVKRWGGTQPTLTHGAWVLAGKWEEEFVTVFGERGAASVKALLTQQKFVGTEEDLASILASHQDRVEILVELKHRLASDLARLGADATSESLAMVGDAAPESAAASTPVPTPAEGATTTLSERSTRVLRSVEPFRGGVGMRWEAAEAAAHVLRTQSVIPAFVGRPGVGRTQAIAMMAAHLAQLPEPMAVWRFGPDTIVSNPGSSLDMVLTDAKSPMVVAIDDLDLLTRLGTDQPDRDFLERLVSTRFHEHVRILVVIDSRRDSRIAVISQALDEALVRLPIMEYPPSTLRAIVDAEVPALTVGRDLSVTDSAIETALSPALATDTMTHPGLALARLDLACARAYLGGAHQTTVDHLGSTSSQPLIKEQAANLTELLSRVVRGQPEAIERVSRRLTLTREKLDLRPERPDGVFLFVGPTGVGKTELAKEIAIHEYGGTDRLIRLDMSEYSQDWSISRIAGPAPGYVGSTEPESWLTTKIAREPRSVVLLDEIEKAHPGVWNLFLQVFDAGRLTDGRGVTADFSRTTIIMTSNLGVRESQTQAVGFGSTTDHAASRDRLLSIVKDRMPPELINRLDEVIVFDPLPLGVIEEIAQAELIAASARLATAGWVVEWDETVPAFLARDGYSEEYGARHLQRSIEQKFLARIATAPSRRVKATVTDAVVQFSPIT
jgi:ATP-dependent Clp protease ATP-binding subunit ClpC